MKLTRFQWIVIGILSILTITVIAIGGFVLYQFNQPQFAEAPTSKPLAPSEPTRVTLPPTWTPTKKQLPAVVDYLLSTLELNAIAGKVIWMPMKDGIGDVRFEDISDSGLVDVAFNAWISSSGSGTLIINIARFIDKSHAEDAYKRLREGSFEDGQIEVLIGQENKHNWAESSCFRDDSTEIDGYICHLHYKTVVVEVILTSVKKTDVGWAIPLAYGNTQLYILRDAGY